MPLGKEVGLGPGNVV